MYTAIIGFQNGGEERERFICALQQEKLGEKRKKGKERKRKERKRKGKKLREKLRKSKRENEQPRRGGGQQPRRGRERGVASMKGGERG